MQLFDSPEKSDCILIEFELNNSKSLQNQIKDYNRKNAETISGLLQGNILAKQTILTQQIVKQYIDSLHPLANEIKTKTKNEQSILNKLVANYNHMFINRLMASDNNMEEFLMYEYLDRHFRSVAARTKSKLNDYKIN